MGTFSNQFHASARGRTNVIQVDAQMNSLAHSARKWAERPNAPDTGFMENELMFRLLFERSADAIVLFDPKAGVFVDCNQAAVELMRSGNKEALLQKKPSDLSPPFQPDGRSSEEKSAEITLLAGASGSYRFEWVARRMDGEAVPLEMLTTPILANGRVLHVVVSRDITERKRAESELRGSQHLLASVADNISEGIYRTGPNHELIFANRAYLRMSGYDSLEDIRGVPREQLYANPPDRARLLDLLAREGSFHNQEIEYVRRGGEHWWGLSSSLAIREPGSGRVLYHVGSVADFTERKKAADEIQRLNASLERRITERTAELTASEARLRTLVEHAPEAIVVFDGDTGRFLSGNAHACRLFGCDAAELTRLSPVEVSPEFQAGNRRSAEVAREKIQEALAGKTPVFDWIHRHSSGRLFATEVRLVRLPAEGRHLLRASIIDNTERHRREKIQQATFQISEAAHTAQDLDGLYRQIHEIVKELMPADNFYIALLDPAGQVLDFPYFVDERDTKPGPIKLSVGLTGYVLRTGKPLLASEDNIVHTESGGYGIVTDGSREAFYSEVGTPAAVWLGVPLIVGDQRIGVMALQSYRDKHAYAEQEKQILTFVASQTAQAIERKRAEQALRESEEKFRALFEGSSQGVLLHDEHQYLQVNPAAARILGYDSPGQLVGRHPRDTSPPIQPGGQDTDALARQHIQECLAKGSARFEWVARRTDGQDVPLDVILTRVEWGGRQIFQASINDISERKQAEAELRASAARLRESEARFSAAFRASPVLITIARMSDGRFVEVNEAFLNWGGYQREEIIGRTSTDLGLWVNLPEREEFWRELQRAGSIRHQERNVRDKHGAISPMLISADIIELNNQPHVLTFGLNITDRKKAETELLKALAREKELGQLKSNFVSMVSHEFRTPLGVIMSSAEILDSYLDQLDPEERREQLQSIQKNSRRMANLMEEVLLLGMVEAGKMEFKPAPLDLSCFTRRLVDELQSATNNQCPVAVSFPADATDAFADERLLQHIFTNLLSNAVKFSPEGGPVQFDIERDGRDAVCRIRDRGLGIPEPDMERMFTAFHRGRNTGRVAGTGLGLTIVKRCVELHRGKIRIESTLGSGTTVTVRLPMFAAG
jgi:PAS domain S-box-containing protein